MRKIVIALGFVLLSAAPAQACRFTIREIGYTPLKLETYIMQLEIDTTKNSGLLNDFIRTASDYAETTNIRYRITQKNGTDTPLLLLMNTKGIPISRRSIRSTGEIRAFYREILFSPLQRTIRQQIGNVFAFLVCFYNEQDEETDQRVEEALEQFRKLAPTLDKSVDEEIMKIVVPDADRQDEAIVMRAAGVDPQNPLPVVMILYGRGRLVDKPMTGDAITRDGILNQLVMLGTDCECGIDLSPLLKRAIPLEWTGRMGQKVADMLHFDVGNPMVLSEMSKILQKDPTTTLDEALTFAPRTIDLDKALGKTKNRKVSPREGSSISRTLKNTLIMAGLLLLLILAAGTGIFLFGKRGH